MESVWTRGCSTHRLGRRDRALVGVEADTRGPLHDVRHVILFVDAVHEMGHGADGVNPDVISAVGLRAERDGRLLEIYRPFC